MSGLLFISPSRLISIISSNFIYAYPYEFVDEAGSYCERGCLPKLVQHRSIQFTVYNPHSNPGRTHLCIRIIYIMMQNEPRTRLEPKVLCKLLSEPQTLMLRKLKNLFFCFFCGTFRCCSSIKKLLVGRLMQLSLFLSGKFAKIVKLQIPLTTFKLFLELSVVI